MASDSLTDQVLAPDVARVGAGRRPLDAVHGSSAGPAGAGGVTEEERSALAFVLEELDASAREIHRRSSEQFNCVASALVTLATVIGLVSEFPDGNLVNLLAAVPWVHAILGYLWVDHHYGIMRQGMYVRSVVEPRVREISGMPDLGRELWCYLDRARRQRESASRVPKSRIGKFFPWLFFVMPSLVSLVAYGLVVYDRAMEAGVTPTAAAIWPYLRAMNLFPIFLIVISLVFIAFLVWHILFVLAETDRWDAHCVAQFAPEMAALESAKSRRGSGA